MDSRIIFSIFFLVLSVHLRLIAAQYDEYTDYPDYETTDYPDYQYPDETPEPDQNQYADYDYDSCVGVEDGTFIAA